MQDSGVVVLGGGLSGVAAAYTLAAAGMRHITVVERGDSLGGLAGSFEREGHFYPLGYHHILHRDRPLHFFLHRIGALDRVRWRRIRMLFHLGGQLHDLGTPSGFLRFPMTLGNKAAFARLMFRAFAKRDWSDWVDRSAADLVNDWGSAGVRETIFEPLTRLKFELPCGQVSGAWLGARLHYREGSAPLGYMPGANWTKVLCDGLERLLMELGVAVRLRTSVGRLHTNGDRITAVELDDGRRVLGDLFVSTIPTEVFIRLVPHDETPELASIRYSALLSVICATRQIVTPDFYWLNLATPGHTACGIFLLNSLNPTIGGPGETCVNFVTHLRSRKRPLFHLDDEALLDRLFQDFRRVLGFNIEPFWINIARVPMYSPVLRTSFRNPPIRSASWRNLYFAGNYRTFPSVVSTGTALGSGVETAEAVLEDQGMRLALTERIRQFRLPGMPRA